MKIFTSSINSFILHIVARRSLVRNPSSHLDVMNQVYLDGSLRYHTGLPELLPNKLACFHGEVVPCKYRAQFPETVKSWQCSAFLWLVSIAVGANQPVLFTIFDMAVGLCVVELALDLCLAMVSYRSPKAICGQLERSNQFTVISGGQNHIPTQEAHFTGVVDCSTKHIMAD